MVRNYKKKCLKSYTEEDVERAINILRTAAEEDEEVPSITKIAKLCNIPRKTLSDRMANPGRGSPGHPPALPSSVEEYLVTGIEFAGEYGWPFDRSDVKRAVQLYCLSLNLKTPFKDSTPGKDWLISFYRRWQTRLSIRTTENLTLQRAKGLTPERKELFFDNLENTLDRLNIKNMKHRIFNLDEIGLATNPKNKGMFIRRGSKESHQIVPSEGKTMYSVLFCCNAAGDILPPYVVYKGTPSQLQSTWMQNGPKDCLYNVSKSGWMEDYVFTSWFVDGFLKYIRKSRVELPVLVVYDGHASHLTYTLVQKAREADVHIYCLPPHTSHLLQPLDVGVYGPTKIWWKDILKKFYRESRQAKVTKAVFPPLLSALVDKMMSEPGNIVNAFAKTGLCPLDRSKIKEAQLMPSIPYSEASTSSTLTMDTHEMNDMTPKKAMREAICSTLTPKQSTTTSIALLNASRKRKRVQKLVGECLTEDMAMERLRSEEEIKANKKLCTVKGKGKGQGKKTKPKSNDELRSGHQQSTSNQQPTLEVACINNPNDEQGLHNFHQCHLEHQEIIQSPTDELPLDEQQSEEFQIVDYLKEETLIEPKREILIGQIQIDKEKMLTPKSSTNYLIDGNNMHLKDIQDTRCLKGGDYLAVVYDNRWYLAAVDEISTEHIVNKEAHIRFMAPPGPKNYFYWPEKEESCCCRIKDILGVLSEPPSAVGRTGRQFSISDAIKREIESKFAALMGFNVKIGDSSDSD